MKRLLAVAAALGLVAIALAIRNSGGDGDTDEPGDEPGPPPAAVDATVICATELADACEALDGVDVRLEDAGDTADRLRAGESPDADAWVVPAPMLEVVESRAPDALDGRGQLLAEDEVHLAVVPSRAAAIERLCPERLRWWCITQNAGATWSDLGGDPSWGAVRIGLPSIRTGLGVGVLGGLAEAYFGDDGFAAQDLDDLEFGDWLVQLARSTDPSDPDPLETLLTRPGAYSAVATRTTADARVELLDADPMISSAIVYVGFTGADDLPDPAGVREALVADGWSSADGPTGAARYKPGVLAALRARWEEVTG